MSPKQPKPGVRTKLNSGENKVKKYDDKSAKTVEPAVPNPTAVAVTQKLPSMRLSTSTNWAEATSASVISIATAVTSERTLSQNMVAPAQSLSLPETAQVSEEPKKPKKKKRETSSAAIVQAEQDAKNKYKRKAKEKKSSIIDDLKDSISQGIDSIKIDYDQLAHIQAELQGSASGVTSTIKDRVGRIKEYANTAMANTLKPEVPGHKKKEPKGEIPKVPPKTTDKKTKDVDVKKLQEQPKSTPISDTSIEEVRKASEVAAESQSKSTKTRDQQLSQAIMSRDGAQKTIASLRAQLNYASPDKKAAIEDRIKKKEAQLADALKLIEELQDGD